MLEVILVCAIFGFIIYLLSKRFKLKISKATDAESAVRIRKYFRIYRIIVKVLFVIIMLFEIIYLAEVWFQKFDNAYFAFRNLMGVIILGMFVYSTMTLPISGITISKFKKRHKEYALYLRGFSTDDYTPVMEEKVEKARSIKNGTFASSKKKDPQQEPFSEKAFQKALNRYLPLYSVGMTKELESPEGSKRIYLDDESWQTDVSYLITNAKYVFIRVNSSDNCIWEIFKSIEIASDKVVYIIDNEDEISKLYNKLEGKLPNGLRIGISKHTLIIKIAGVYTEYLYRNDHKGYKKLFKEIFRQSAFGRIAS